MAFHFDEDSGQRLPPQAIPSYQVLSYKGTGLQKNQYMRLKSGRLVPDSSIDLHGLTVKDAHQQLQRYFDRALNQRHRVLHIIHGKGGHQGSKIKGLTYQWLKEQNQVLAFSSAPVSMGDTGALLVLLKKT